MLESMQILTFPDDRDLVIPLIHNHDDYESFFLNHKCTSHWFEVFFEVFFVENVEFHGI